MMVCRKRYSPPYSGRVDALPKANVALFSAENVGSCYVQSNGTLGSNAKLINSLHLSAKNGLTMQTRDSMALGKLDKYLTPATASTNLPWRIKVKVTDMLADPEIAKLQSPKVRLEYIVMGHPNATINAKAAIFYIAVSGKISEDVSTNIGTVNIGSDGARSVCCSSSYIELTSGSYSVAFGFRFRDSNPLTNNCHLFSHYLGVTVL